MRRDPFDRLGRSLDQILVADVEYRARVPSLGTKSPPHRHRPLQSSPVEIVEPCRVQGSNPGKILVAGYELGPQVDPLAIVTTPPVLGVATLADGVKSIPRSDGAGNRSPVPGDEEYSRVGEDLQNIAGAEHELGVLVDDAPAPAPCAGSWRTT